MEERRKISFHFHMGTQGQGPGAFAVEKDEGGRKRRYLEGITSGIKVDGHGERMTENCIASFQRQAKSGDILLYEGVHGVNFVDDIGKLVDSSIDGQGNWHTVYRLYDELDGFAPGSATIEKADKLWRQVNGLPPYTRPRQKGFSIEGELVDGGLQTMDSTGKRVMDDVALDGVVVVNRPAYQDSIAHAVMKALGLPGPWKVRKELERSLASAVDEAEEEDSYFRRKFRLDDALEAQVAKIMSGPDVERAAQLETVFGEYADLAVREAMSHPDVFKGLYGSSDAEGTAYSVSMDEGARLHALKQLESALTLELQLRSRRVGRSRK